MFQTIVVFDQTIIIKCYHHCK